ncbi:MAG: AAA family ATPase [Dehalococcoidia bacterium]
MNGEDFEEDLGLRDGRRMLSEVRVRETTWLWPGRAPLGALTLLEGDPGVGKSTIAADIAARVTRGTAMPDGSIGSHGAAGVVLLAAEDSVEETLTPRFLAAGGDADRAAIREHVKPNYEEALPTIADLKEIRGDLRDLRARLLVIDPLSEFLPGETNTNNDMQVRQALRPLLRLCDQLGVAVLGVRHLRKQETRNSLHAGGGSIAFTAAARSVLLCARAAGGPASEFVIAQSKLNLGPRAPSLRYRIVAADGTSRVEWLEESSETADELLAGPEERYRRDMLEEAKEFLREILRDGPVPKTHIDREAESAGISTATLRRAIHALGLGKHKQGMKTGWLRFLPEHAEGAQESPKALTPEQ